MGATGGTAGVFVFTVLLLACNGQQTSPAAPIIPQRPDVVLITLDTTRADRLGAYGYAGASTDTIDALAARGTRFVRAESVLPLTIPAHSTLFTGLFPFHHNVRSNGDNVLADGFTTLAEHFQAAGYATGASVAAFVTTRQWGFAQGFDGYFDAMPEQEVQTPQSRNYWHTERAGAQVVDDALAWLATVPKDKPVFLWVHLYDAHFPYTPAETYASAQPGKPYDAELAYVDDQVARVEQAFVARPTLFTLVADHGECLGEHDEQQHGSFAYECTQNVPWIVSGPGVPVAVVDTPVSQADVAPTILKLAGLPVPPGMDGAPQPGGGTVPYSESYQLVDRFRFAPHRAVLDGTWKLIATPKPELYDLSTDPGELTNLAAANPEKVASLRAKLDALGATPPGKTGEVDAATMEALASLGYVTGSSGGIDPFSLPDVKDFPDFIKKSEGLARLAGGDQKLILASLDELLAQKPDAFDLRSRKMRLLFQAGKAELAKSFAEETAALFPDDARVWVQLATTAAQETQWARVVEMATKALSLEPKSKTARELSVDAQLRLGKAEAAIPAGVAWMAEDPANYGLAAVLGRYFLTQQDYAKAERYLRMATAGPNPKRGARVQLAALAVAADARHDAYKLLESEVKEYPRNVLAHRALSRLYADDGRWLDQKTSAEAVVTLLPLEPLAYLDLAQCSFNLGDYDSARRTLDLGLTMASDDPDLLLLHANLLAKEGKKDEGKAVFDRASTLHKTRAAERAAAAKERTGKSDKSAPSPANAAAGSPKVENPNTLASPKSEKKP